MLWATELLSILLIPRQERAAGQSIPPLTYPYGSIIYHHWQCRLLSRNRTAHQWAASRPTDFYGVNYHQNVAG